MDQLDHWKARGMSINYSMLKESADNAAQASGQASLSPRSNAPRIPSLTLPKPSLATVRKFSGLGPDMESIREERRGIKGKWKSDSKLKWNTTV